MPENKNEFIDEDISKLLTATYREVDIDDDFRVKLQVRTRNAVGASRPYILAKWIAGLGLGMALAAAIVLVLLHTHSAPTAPRTRQIVRAETKGSVDRNHPSVPPSVTAIPAPDVRVFEHPRCLAGRTTSSTHVSDQANVASENPKPATGVHYGAPVAVVVAAASTSTKTVGYRVRSGEPVLTDKSMLTLVTPMGSELVLDRKSQLVLNSDGTAALKSGRLLCRNRDHEIRVISTPGGRFNSSARFSMQRLRARTPWR